MLKRRPLNRGKSQIEVNLHSENTQHTSCLRRSDVDLNLQYTCNQISTTFKQAAIDVLLNSSSPRLYPINLNRAKEIRNL